MTPKSQSRRYHLGTRATLWLLVLQAGCLYGGPKSVYRDRFDYSTALADSWKQQLLLNIVKARYMDPPIFIDVAQVVTSYTNEGQANFSGNTASGSPASRTIGVNGRWAESPTITYNPLQGEQFTKSLLTPIPPRALFSMVQAGWPIDAVLGIGVRIMNGLYATSSTAALQNRGDTTFYKVLRMLREEQMSGASPCVSATPPPPGRR